MSLLRALVLSLLGLNAPHALRRYAMHSNGGGYKDLNCIYKGNPKELSTPDGGTVVEDGSYDSMGMNGRKVYSFATREVPTVPEEALEQAGRGGAPVVVNNINNSQSNPVISNQSTTMKVPDSVRSADPTFALARQSFSY